MRSGVIVEGHGDVEAAPILLRRLCLQIRPAISVEMAPPYRLARSKLTRPGEVERAVELVARKIGPGEPILVLADADRDCPAGLAVDLLARASRQRGDRSISVVLAKTEFEAWFLAAAPSLAGHRGLPPDLGRPADPEGVRDAKGWLGAQMPHGYSKVLDQPAFAAVMDIEQAVVAPSFSKLFRDVSRMLAGTGAA
jgi:hypothetical protein